MIVRIGVLFVALLIWSAQSMATEWVVASELKSTRRAGAADFKELKQQLASRLVGYNFESNNYLVHDGDLTIEGNFDCDTLLVVKGKLTVGGMYNDYRSNIGVLVVLGDMDVDQLYSWGALYVQKDLTARGLILTVYNDFTFEVGGKVNARALVISDKSADYKAGKLGVVFDDDAASDQRLRALREFVPELYTDDGHLEFEEGDEFESLRFDDGAALKRMTAGQPIFRQNPASATLGAQVNLAISADVGSDELLTLIKADVLLAQLIAARIDLPESVVQTLIKRDDPTIKAWLSQSHPELVQSTTGSSLTPELAQRLASNVATPFASLQQLATHSDAKVRAQLAEHDALPNNAQGRALMTRLLDDADPAVQAAILGKFAHLSAFGWVVSDKKIDALIAAAEPKVLEALANVHLNAGQADKLIAALTPVGLNTLARSLYEQAQRLRPTRLSAAQIDGLALKIIALPAAKDSWQSSYSDALLALSPELQLGQLNQGIERRVMDPEHIGEHTHSIEVMAAIRDLGIKHAQAIPEKLASNPLLPVALQLQIVEAAAKSPDPDSAPMETLDELLNNDDAAPEAIIAATELILKIGALRAGDGPLFHHRKLPAEAIEKMEQKYSYSEDWALTLMSQPHASVAQRVRSLKRWYDSDADLQQSLADAESWTEVQFYERLARSNSADLQEQAVQHLRLPLALVRELQKSPFENVAGAAKVHPSIALADLPLGMLSDEATLRSLPRNDPEDWLKLSQSLPRLQARVIAHQRFGAAMRRAK